MNANAPRITINTKQKATGIDTASGITRDVLSLPLPSASPKEDPDCPNTKESPTEYRI